MRVQVRAPDLQANQQQRQRSTNHVGRYRKRDTARAIIEKLYGHRDPRASAITKPTEQLQEGYGG